ncbi:hypothetical protein BX257_0468 [Streptomyces sp. 3212.3]|nr:hypothetical protein BX257_0468 [Streptomyces sp. 3212.3]
MRAITDLSYFDGAHAINPLLTLGTWAVVSALLVWGRTRYQSTRPRQAQPSGTEATAPAAVGATARPGSDPRR